ncbi:MAG: DUF6498-containing protein [Sedimentisphaerales bacterium]
MNTSDTPSKETAGEILKLTRPFWADLSLWALLGSNLWTLILALYEKWPLADLLWTFWFQSVAIGIFWFFKILTLKNFSTDGLEMGDRPVPPTIESRNKVAFFFLVHYGFFHLGYAIFLISQHPLTVKWPVFLTAAVFFANHLFSFVHNRKWDDSTKQNLGVVLFFPYARIIPMHLTIIFGSTLGPVGGSYFIVIFFMFLKTFADSIMHVIENTKFGSRSVL